MKDFVLVTGLSGAGKSQAAAVLEDLGFFCVDNLPAELIPPFAELCMAAEGKYDRVALVSDIRGLSDPAQLEKSLRSAVGNLRILFLEASEKTILNRYKETRRRHPLDPEGHDIRAAVLREKEILDPLRRAADLVLDTTNFPPARLRLRLTELFQCAEREEMNIHVCSFGYRNGLPEGADLVIDVRFLPNPFYVPELKSLSGLDAPVRDYVFSFRETTEFLDKLRDMLAFLLPQYRAEGKSSLMIAFGCTGGRHRSVAIAEHAAILLKEMNCPVDCVHRDLR